MSFKVLVSEDVERDIEDIYRYIAEHDGIENAERALTGLEGVCLGLARFPRRGNVPKELRPLGISEYREAHYKPYRIIYRIMNRTVVIYCVVDGRRDMQSLLHLRLLR